MKVHNITFIPGDGIGPEVMESAKQIIQASGVKINWDERMAGARAFRQGIETGVPQETIDSILRTKVVFKGPLETPVGFGEKSANVTLRKLFETFANVRPVSEFKGVTTPYSGRNLDIVLIRENVEDLYAGIEHMQTPTVAQCLKLVSQHGSEKVIRFAFEYARLNGRRKIHCATKANIMKLTEGLFKRTFEEVSKEYPDIEAGHVIVDNCAHQLVKRPEQFDVIVTTNMNGDILSDLTSALVGGLGFAPSANIGHDFAIFEAVHGSAPKYAGKNQINPSAAILSSVLLLKYLGESVAAERIENALRKTWENPYTQTRDVVGDERAIGTKELTQMIISNLSESTTDVRNSTLRVDTGRVIEKLTPAQATVETVTGIDIFVQFSGSPTELGEKLISAVDSSAFWPKMISNRGTQVFPGTTNTSCVDHWRCRLLGRSGEGVSDRQIYDLLFRLSEQGLTWVHLEKLRSFNGVPGYTKAQGEL